MKRTDNKQAIFDMLEDGATKSIAVARNACTYGEIDDCYVGQK